MFALILHFVLGLRVVALIESPVFDSCKDCACCEKPEERDEMEMDDDVLDEEGRVEALASGDNQDRDLEERAIEIDVEDAEA